ncbi:hypothetical protein [Niallia oryzisoli]|uniref:hypothetical protein n=1 Tax=Niallia oryzisoli TaxID=1737571 RepID=UPI0037357880
MEQKQSYIKDNKEEKDLYGLEKEMSLQFVQFATTDNPYFNENDKDDNEKE